MLIASENAPKHRSILYAAFAQQLAHRQPAGHGRVLRAERAAHPSFLMWGWRIPFLLSAVLVIIGMVIRLKLEESADMQRVLARKRTVKLLRDVVRDHWVVVCSRPARCR